MKTLSFVLFLLMITAHSISAQVIPNQDDKQLITAQLETYFKGWIAKDTVLLSSVMHTSCHLKYMHEGVFHNLNKTEYLNLFKDKTPRNSAVKTDILFIDVTGTIAQAKIKIERETSIGYDYFNLIKFNDVWQIVDKVSASTSK